MKRFLCFLAVLTVFISCAGLYPSFAEEGAGEIEVFRQETFSKDNPSITLPSPINEGCYNVYITTTQLAKTGNEEGPSKPISMNLQDNDTVVLNLLRTLWGDLQGTPIGSSKYDFKNPSTNTVIKYTNNRTTIKVQLNFDDNVLSVGIKGTPTNGQQPEKTDENGYGVFLENISADLSQVTGLSFTALKEAVNSVVICKLTDDPFEKDVLSLTEKLVLNGQDANAVTKALNLPAVLENGTTVSWEAEPAGIINCLTGEIFPQAEQDTPVTLTATLTESTAPSRTQTLTYHFTVKGVDMIRLTDQNGASVDALRAGDQVRAVVNSTDFQEGTLLFLAGYQNGNLDSVFVTQEGSDDLTQTPLLTIPNDIRGYEVKAMLWNQATAQPQCKPASLKDDTVMTAVKGDILNIDLEDGTWNDSSSYQTSVTPGGTAPVIDTDPDVGPVIRFDGSNLLKYELSQAQRTAYGKQFTLEVAFQRTGGENSTNTIIADNKSSGIGFESNSKNRCELWAHRAGGYVGGTSKLGLTLENDKWYHLIATYDGSNYIMYVNGREIGRISESGNTTTPSTIPMIIGGDNKETPNFTGKIALAKVYSYALNSSQVKGNYSQLFQNKEVASMDISGSTELDIIRITQDGMDMNYEAVFAYDDGSSASVWPENNIRWTFSTDHPGITLENTHGKTAKIHLDNTVQVGDTFTLTAQYLNMEASKTITVIRRDELRIGVMGDFQLKAGRTFVVDKMRTMLKRYKAQDIDVLIIPGDITDSATAAGYDMYRNVMDEIYPPGTYRPHVVSVMGNHDYWNGRFDKKPNDIEAAQELYQEKMGVPVHTHTMVGGYHFIAVSLEYDSKDNNSNNGIITPETQAWFAEQMRIAQEDDPTKPIFVVTHAHIQDTVYGSANWSNGDLKDILSQYPQAVTFSGHSHYTIYDERSIHQEDFTSMGCSSLFQIELETGKQFTKPNNPNERGEALSLVIKPGSIAATRWDVKTNRELKAVNNDWIIRWNPEKGITKADFTYTTEGRKAARSAPVFAPDSTVRINSVTSTSASLTFDVATHEDFVESYTVRAVNTATGNTEKTVSLYSDFLEYTHSPTQSCTIEGLSANTEYRFEVEAVESFGNTSAPITVTGKTNA